MMIVYSACQGFRVPQHRRDSRRLEHENSDQPKIFGSERGNLRLGPSLPIITTRPSIPVQSFSILFCVDADLATAVLLGTPLLSHSLSSLPALNRSSAS